MEEIFKFILMTLVNFLVFFTIIFMVIFSRHMLFDIHIKSLSKLIFKNKKRFNTEKTSKQQTFNKDELLKELDGKRRFNKKFKYITHFLAIAISIIGTILLFSGIILSYKNSTQLSWLTVSSGVIVEFISVIHFWLVAKTTKEVKNDNDQLIEKINFLLANELIDKMQDNKIKDETYAKMIESLMTKKY